MVFANVIEKRNIKTSSSHIDRYDAYEGLVFDEFIEDKERIENFEKRITFKDDQITGLDTEPKSDKELAVRADEEKWNQLMESKEIVIYTWEYITLKRKKYILTLIEYLKELDSNFSDESSFDMYFKLFTNEIYNIYEEFIKIKKDEHFLSIINLVEEMFHNNEMNKKLIKSAIDLLKLLKGIDDIDYSIYELSLKKLFDHGINTISIEEKVIAE